MSSLDDPATKNKYQKCKFRVKRWESDFMDKYGRKPNKNDIRSADPIIKESYKIYWKLKTQVLEETLLDITFSDDVQSNVTLNNTLNESLSAEVIFNTTVNHKGNPEMSKDDNNTQEASINPPDAENIAPKNWNNEISSTSEYSATPTLKNDNANVEGVFGEHLNQKKESSQRKTSMPIGKTSSFQLSQKKFNSSTFSKRNPRKSLSMTKNKSKIDLNKSTNQIDNLNKSTTESDTSVVVDRTSLLFSEIKVLNHESNINIQSVNPIQDVLNGKPLTGERKLDLDWIDRCTKDCDLEVIGDNSKRLSGVSDSGIESIDAHSHEIQDKSLGTSEDLSDDDFVCNSDVEEEDNKNKRIRNWKRMLSDMSMQLAKRPKLDTDENLNNSSHLSKAAYSPYRTFVDNSINNSINNHEKTLTEKENKMKEYEFVDTEDGTMTDEKSLKNDKTNSLNHKNKLLKSSNRRNANSSRSKATKSQKNETKVKRSRVSKRTSHSLKKRNRRSKGELSNEESTENHSDDSESGEQGPQIPIYNIESLNVTPRFAVPQETKGNLISEFCQSINVNESLINQEIISSKEKPKSLMTSKEKLEAKIAAGKLNENFVRINLKKKVFVKGKKSFNFSRYKKTQWRHKKKELASGEGSLDLADLAEKNTCFRCGGSNHIARKCPAMQSDELLPLEETQISDYPTLEEAKKMASQEATKAHCHRIHSLPECSRSSDNTNEESLKLGLENLDTSEDVNEEDFDDFEEDEEEEFTSSTFTGHKIPKELINKLLPPVNGVIEPLYPVSDSGKLIETPQEVFDALKLFGHKNFRPGQEKAVMRVLSGQSTLVTLSTGSGKSLCYQLPAYLYAKRSHCITLVISPLVSLMDDQVTGIPKFISAAALHTGHTPKVREKIINAIKEGEIDILLVSPEAIVAGEKSTGFGSLLRQLPPIAFACIDEAHCISQWSHNFRPSYLMVCRVLIEKLGVKTILGLTATATRSTAESIVRHLTIPDGMDGVIKDIPVPNNLSLTVSKDDQRDRALIELLRSQRFKECDSIIIYCTRREECVRITGLLRASFREYDDPNCDKSKSKAKTSSIAEAYHAGLPPSRRKVIQKAFMNGNTRIVVATVAFGMGINKSNIRSVIHYNMPSNFEGYVQEVGRAGRDQLPAHCHLFISPKEDQDKWELRRHIYANGVDRHTIRKLLQKIFIPCSCSNNRKKCPGHEVAIPIDTTVQSLDISEETISTLLCYLELHPKKFITVLSSVYVNAKVSSYNGVKALKAAAQMSPPLAMAIAMDRKRGISHDNDTIIEFPVVDVAAAIGWDSGVVKSHLKNLEWETIDGKPKRSAINVKFDTLGLRVRAPGDLSDAELDEALDALAERTQSQQTVSLQQLEMIYTVLNKFSYQSVQDCKELTNDNIENSNGLKNLIRSYFQSSSPLSIIEIPRDKNDKVDNETQIISDIRSLINSYRDNNFSGRAVARIFHGIQSPNYSALTWSRCRFWRAHLTVDFNWIVQTATREILAMR
ncbi:ATP-dependent DNA helicase Q4 [Chelonus insularis]|uniref:ATP-dependent DNA helicase Q4 n=1 Tax=Chelonus insularis TaxID=460826 RepID=UPI00158B21D2|nr:ATP-dependent DNA helicase Q4 [Chelonus insularis]